MSDSREQILESIKVQGEVVRKLKAAKEPKEKVCFDQFCIAPFQMNRKPIGQIEFT